MSKTDALVTRLISKCSEKGYRIKEVAKSVGIDSEKVSEWGKGVTSPTEEELTLICNKIDYPVQNLLPYLTAEKENGEVYAEQTSESEGRAETPLSTESMAAEVEDPVAPENEDFMPSPQAPQETPDTGTEKNEEKSMETEVKKERKKRASTPRKPRTQTTPIVSDATITLVREVLGLKKSDAITEATMQEAYKKLHADMKGSLAAMMTLHTEFVKANNKPTYTEDVLALAELAKNASKEGIELASQILRKFTK